MFNTAFGSVIEVELIQSGGVPAPPVHLILSITSGRESKAPFGSW